MHIPWSFLAEEQLGCSARHNLSDGNFEWAESSIILLFLLDQYDNIQSKQKWIRILQHFDEMKEKIKIKVCTDYYFFYNVEKTFQSDQSDNIYSIQKLMG